MQKPTLDIRPGLLYPHQDWIIDGLLPKREVSLIAGPAGGGKTTFSIDMNKAIKHGEPWFERSTHPCPIVFVTCDRSEYDYHRTMDRMKLPFDLFHFFCQRDSKTTVETIARRAASEWPECFIYIDGMGTLVPDGKLNDYNTVADFLRAAGQACLEYNVTIMGSCHSPKMKEGEQFDNLRQRVLGSTAWGGFTDLMIIVDPDAESTEENKIRKISILPRHDKEFDLRMSFANGVFTPYVDPKDGESSSLMDYWMRKLPYDTCVPMSVIIDEAKANAVPKRTLERWLGEQVKTGTLRRESRGNYLRARVS